MILRSPRLSPVAHGFSLRTGGVSTGRYASLNLAGKWGDDPAHVAENRRRFAAAGGFAVDRLFIAKQVHGAAVAVVTTQSAAEISAASADAIVSAVPGAALAVLTADCVPILVRDDHGRAAAIHAGWRGTVADVVGRAVDAMVALGAERGALRAAIGPSICVRCFEVGAEVAAQFDARCTDTRYEKPHIDLRVANRERLIAAGISAAAIEDTPPCTMCEPARFFSYRRDGGQIGQHLSFIVAGPT